MSGANTCSQQFLTYIYYSRGARDRTRYDNLQLEKTATTKIEPTNLVWLNISSSVIKDERCIFRAIPLIFAVMLMGLALCKAASTWRETQGFKGVVLIKVLIQDQVLYFLL